ncbi:hypothetical protein PT974_08178 [Cladobotryum mycophilum]|uniref:Uncharacterized protein n=1 Tax=Cladobotryum mycophilum TaxID=491253 RepID=A0ABR0SDS5_9HYPO
MSAATASLVPVTTFEFVVGNRPDQLKGGSSKRIRSHLSKQSWKAHFAAQQEKQAASSTSSSSSPDAIDENPPPQPQQNDERSKKKKRRRRQLAVTYELEVDADGGHEATIIRGTDLGRALIRGDDVPSWPMLPPVDRFFGGARVDPFKSYPGPWKEYMPRLVDHYITHMAVDIPELDQPGNKGLLRSRWFRLANTDISTFQVVMLLSAANIITVKGGIASELGFHMYELKHEALNYINAAFKDEQKRLSDMLIGAVAKMASFEAMHGDVHSFRLHMTGLKRMVQMRGGLTKLGLGGLLRRMIVWIDLNGGLLLDEPRYFPGQTFTGDENEIPEPNPERFIAI